MLRHGLDLSKLISKSPARAWNALYSMLTENMDKKQREKLDSDLFRRPQGEDRQTGDAFDLNLQSAAAAYLKTLDAQRSGLDSSETSEGVTGGKDR